jgi:hypothetical protein
MNAKRVLTPVLMIAVCVVILASYKVAAVSKPTRSPTPALDLQSRPTSSPQLTTPTAQQSPSNVPEIGDAAPDFTLPSVWEETVALSSYRRERNVVLLFYRTGS